MHEKMSVATQELGSKKEETVIKVMQHFEFEVLMAVYHLENDAYPAEIGRRLSQKLDRHVSIAQVFGTLERLEDKDYVSSHESKPEPVRGGRRRRIFKIEASGTQALRLTAAAFSRMSSSAITESSKYEYEWNKPSPA
jgi:PadR family transcriptional regulator PadR